MKPLHRNILVLLALVLANVFLAYSNHFQNSFHFDDSHTIENNPYIRTLANIPMFFEDATTFSTLPANRMYRPVISTSLAVDYHLAGGLHPFWFHVSTFFWYLVQLTLMFLLFWRILELTFADPRNPLVALFATAIYGLHPVCAETVNYVIQRGDLYSTLGVVSGLALYAWSPRLRRFGLYLIPVAVALLAKPPALVFPVLLFVYDFLFEEKPPQRSVVRSLVRSIPALLVCAAMMGLQAKMTPKTFTPSILSAHDYIITQPYVSLRYFGKFFLLLPLSADSDLGSFRSIFEPDALLGFLFIGLLLFAAWRASGNPRWRPVGFGLWWFFISLVPTAVFPLSEVENDHRMFMPFVGLTLSVSWAAGLWLYQRGDSGTVPAFLRKALLPGIVVLLLILTLGTRARNEVWHSEESLWYDVTQASPHNGRGLMNYGLTQMGKADYAQALTYFNNALKYTPNYYTLEINLGIANGEVRNDAEAERHFKRALELEPRDAQPYYFYARWLKGRGRSAESLAYANIGVGLNPSYMDARYLAMQGYWDSGDQAKLQALAADTLHIAPNDPTALSYLNRQATARPANVVDAPPVTANDFLELSLNLHRAGKFKECIAAAQQALRMDPTSAIAYNNIAAAYESMQQWDQAIDAAQQALRLNPTFEMAKNNLLWSMSQKQKEKDGKR